MEFSSRLRNWGFCKFILWCHLNFNLGIWGTSYVDFWFVWFSGELNWNFGFAVICVYYKGWTRRKEIGIFKSLYELWGVVLMLWCVRGADSYFKADSWFLNMVLSNKNYLNRLLTPFYRIKCVVKVPYPIEEVLKIWTISVNSPTNF